MKTCPRETFFSSDAMWYIILPYPVGRDLSGNNEIPFTCKDVKYQFARIKVVIPFTEHALFYLLIKINETISAKIIL